MQIAATSDATTEAPQNDHAIEAFGLVKRYPLFNRRRDRLWALLGVERGLFFKTALDDVSFSMPPGEALGIIGENGSGKSTLLRLVAGVSAPDAGRVLAKPPVAAILELGLGFHPDFTGRENAVLYGSLLGLPAADMLHRLPEVIEFAELGEFIDQPIRTYSTGMTARLAFAVATQVDPQVLVVDEALAVGDGAFQKKCVDRMVRFRNDGRTVLFCSHAMYLVSSFCQRALWLKDGRIAALGPTQDVIREYELHLASREKRTKERADAAAQARGPAVAAQRGRIERPEAFDLSGKPRGEFAPGEGFELRCAFSSADEATMYHFGLAIDSPDGRCLFATSTQAAGLPPLSGRKRYELCLRLLDFPAGAGDFHMSCFLFDEHQLHIYDQLSVDGVLSITGNRWSPALLELPHQWSVG